MLTTATGRPAGPDQAQAGRVVQGQAGEHPRAAEHAAHGAVGGLRVEDARPDRPGGGKQGTSLVITAHERIVCCHAGTWRQTQRCMVQWYTQPLLVHMHAILDTQRRRCLTTACCSLQLAV
jgi:hypothetical protein